MKTAVMFAKARKGKGGKFRVLKFGEVIQEGDLELDAIGVWDVGSASAGMAVHKNEAIIRLEFDK